MSFILGDIRNKKYEQYFNVFRNLNFTIITYVFEIRGTAAKAGQGWDRVGQWTKPKGENFHPGLPCG